MVDHKEKTLTEFQHEVDALVNVMGGYWPPLGMLAAVMEELGEVSRVLMDIEQIKAKKAGSKIPDLSEEMADTLYALICIANYYKIDLGTALDKSMDKFRIRDKTRFQQKNA
jgi:NTP pyrophosphatase (non-canonical NTP hydrolase)